MPAHKVLSSVLIAKFVCFNFFDKLLIPTAE
jgi:hypothetical protein